MPSSNLDLIASAFNLRTNSPVSELFRWQVQAVDSGTTSPSGRISLLFGSGGSAPKDTGFFINSDGKLKFAPGQQIPLNAIQTALDDAGLKSDPPERQRLPPIVNTAGYEWQQIPQGQPSIHVGSNTLTLKPCPRGVNGNDAWHYIYISGTGEPEAVLINGGTCVSEATGGTINFVAAHAHGMGYRLGTATAGVQEAVNAAIASDSKAQISRRVLIDPGDHLFHARLSIRSSGLSISASGATITCAMRDTCVMMGDPSDTNLFGRITLDSLRIRPGVQNGTWPAVEDDAEGSTISNLGPVNGSADKNSFGSLIQVDNDQAATISGLSTLGPWSRCDATFCSTAIVGPGPFSKNAGILWIENSNLSLNCTANGIDNRNGNTLKVQNSIVQAYPQFGIRSKAQYGTMMAAQVDNVYEEVGNCVNPQFNNLQAEAGLIVINGIADVQGASPFGNVPQFANNGTIVYGYWIVANSSTSGPSPAYFAGYANTNGSGNIPVYWYQIGSTGTVTYDVLRKTMTDQMGAWDTPPYGTGDFAIPGNAVCSNNLCLVVDNAASTPSTYTVVPNPHYFPYIPFWPGSVILTGFENSSDSVLTTAQTGAYGLPTGGYVSNSGSYRPSVFAAQEQCCDGGPMTNTWISATAGDSVGGNFGPVGAQLIQQAATNGNTANLKGRMNFVVPTDGSVANSEVITIGDCNVAKTLATTGGRPTYDPCDTYIGLDNPNAFPLNFQLAIGAPVSISNYINNGPDGSSWLEQLTSSVKTLKVPVNAPAYQTTSNCADADGLCGSATAGRVTIAPGAKSATVITSAVNEASEIDVNENTTYGHALGVTCDTSLGRHFEITEQTPGTGFVVTTDIPSLTNYVCLSYTTTN
jgi:hypothetical protein